jgi:putative inorganic carbon (hco3(-)) transporter
LKIQGNIVWILALSLVYLVVNMLFTFQGSLWFNLFPVVLMVLYIGFIKLDLVFFLIVLSVPLSIQLSELVKGLPFDLYLPSELLLIAVLLLFILKLASHPVFDNRILNHRVSIAVYFYLFWMLFTSVTSTMPMVSFKFLLSHIWFVIVFFFIATQVFSEQKNIARFYWAYLIPLMIVIVYTVTRHAGFGFTQVSAHFVMKPFFKDHTSYGAALAMFLPVILGLLWLNKKNSLLRTIALWFTCIVIITALVLSYTRAAWLSVAGAMVVFVVMMLRIRFTSILVLLSVIALFGISYHSEIKMRLESNRQASSKDLSEHVKSMANIANDVSNLERLNRWHSALSMFREKPVFGFGPGTYMFRYAPYQVSSDKTSISTDFGIRGNAHSEYIGPLAESGVLGMVSMLVIITLVIYTGVVVYGRARNASLKVIALVSMLGLVTYYIHGVLNNFLDTDKASAPFWGFTAILVALDVYHVNPSNPTLDYMEKNSNE